MTDSYDTLAPEVRSKERKGASHITEGVMAIDRAF